VTPDGLLIIDQHALHERILSSNYRADPQSPLDRSGC
jgi:DNA mismatch repair ATPase MutL